VLAPEPLRLINPRWEFQDANWWPDWPTSARKIAWFYRQAGGSSVDGVVAIDVSAAEALLELTGPIAMPAYGVTITADNFAATTQAEVEGRHDRFGNRPRQFIADLAPLFRQRLEAAAAADSARLAEVLTRALAEKHILLYRDDAAAEASLQALGWAGALADLPAQTDTLSVVHTNIGGGKSDAVIRDVVSHEVQLQEDGRLAVTVTLTRTHEGQRGEPFYGVRNVDYLRVYVPAGSRLVAAEGFSAPDESLFEKPDPDLVPDQDLQATLERTVTDPVSGVRAYEEFGRTVFAHWLMVDPGTSATVRLRYDLPWRLSSLAEPWWQPWAAYFGWAPDTRRWYRFRWEKQPGMIATELTHTWQSRSPLRRLQASRPLERTADGWRWADRLATDAALTVTFDQAD
jgi:hypothetical protein